MWISISNLHSKLNVETKFEELYDFILNSDFETKSTFLNGLMVKVEDAETIVNEYNEVAQKAIAVKAEQAKAEEKMALAMERAEEAAQKAMQSMLVTSGFNFDGHTITKYSAHIASDEVHKERMSGGGWFSEGNLANQDVAIKKALVELRKTTLQDIKRKAYDLGCNAIIGLDFSYTTLGPYSTNNNNRSENINNLEYYIFLSYKGNAVVIEKTED